MRWLVFTILLACKGDPKPATTGSGSGDEQKPVPTVRERPSLPDKPVPSKVTNADFDGEPRDDEWAPPVETEIKQRFAKLRGAKLETTECRHSRCRLTIVGSEGDVAQTIADLEGPRGLHGYAKNILLTAPSKKPDGTIELNAIATFDR